MCTELQHRVNTVSPQRPAVGRVKPHKDDSTSAAYRIGADPRSCRPYADTNLSPEAIRAADMDAVVVRKMVMKR